MTLRKDEADAMESLKLAVAALRETQAELAHSLEAYLTWREKEDTTPMQMNRRFWIQLARLAALMEELDSHAATLEKFGRSPQFKTLDTATQVEMAKIRKTIDDIRHID